MQGRTTCFACRAVCVALSASLWTSLASPASAQQPGQVNPVYVDDSPAAADTFGQLHSLLAAGNLDEAVRVLQALLDEQADRLVAVPGEPDLFTSVRSAVHRALLADPKLLARYRTLQDAGAQRRLEEGRISELEHSYLLTGPGFEAALRLAQDHIESARFDSAHLVLAQLDQHPGRTGDGANQAADMLSLLARYLPERPVLERLKRWTEQARNANANPPPVQTWPEAARSRGSTPLDTMPPLNTTGMISKPLWTALAGDPAAMLGEGPPQGRIAGGGNIPPMADDLLCLPAVWGDTVYFNDGTSIRAFDRFTLAPRWSVSPGLVSSDATPVDESAPGKRFERPDYRAWNASAPDVSAMTIRAGTLIAATGRALAGARDGDDRIHAIDAESGRLRWSRILSELDPALSDCSVRGPACIDQGTAVFGVRKYVPERRLAALTLIGLDVNSGDLLWIRAVGSVGSMPWLGQSGAPHAAAAADGIVYRSDAIGVIGAYETRSGRPLWVRRQAIDALRGQDRMEMPWHINVPIIDNDSLVLIAPDGQNVIRLDRATGTELASRPTDRFGSPAPDYLLRGGDTLVAVGPDRLALVPLTGFESETIRLTPTFPNPGVHGRVVVSGDRVLVPLTTGFAIVNPQQPDAEPTLIPLDEPGHLLALQSQLIVADDARLHSYLLWDVAESLLVSRMKADPADPTPATTFAELAYRAGRHDRILAAVDASLAALKNDPDSLAMNAARERLYQSLNTMLAASLEPAPVVPPEGTLQTRLAQAPRITDNQLLQFLAERLGRTARSPAQQLSHILASGRLEDILKHPADAVRIYQRILDDPALAAAMWSGLQVSVRGELEATQRIEALMAAAGPDVYAPQELAAGNELKSLGEPADTRPLESLVARFPLASVAPEVWLRLGQMYRAADRPHDATAAFESGLKAAARVRSPDQDSVGRLSGELVTELQTRGQVAAALELLRSVRQRFPNASLRTGAGPIDAESLAAELSGRVASVVRWPRIGPPRAEGVQSLSQWTILPARLRELRPSVVNSLVLEGEKEVSIWAPETMPDADARDPASLPAPLLRQVWATTNESGDVEHLRTVGDSTFMLLSLRTAPTLARISTTDGSVEWRTQPLTKIFAAHDDNRGLNPIPGVREDRFQTPDNEEVKGTDMLVHMDERTLAVVQRSGKVACFDTETGQLLWSARTPVGRVYDADLGNGALVIAGDEEVVGPGGIVTDLTPLIQTFDARTGRTMQRVGDLGGGGHPHLVRITETGSLIACLDAAVVCLDLSTAKTNWTLATAELMPVSDAWIFGDRLLMLAPTTALWLATVSTGRLHPTPLEGTQGRIDDPRAVRAFTSTAAPDSEMVISTAQGLVVFAGDGTLRGTDALGGLDLMIPPQPAEGRAISIETISEGRAADGLLIFSIHGLDTRNATLSDTRQILLGSRPSILALMDGRIALSAGGATIILQAPR